MGDAGAQAGTRSLKTAATVLRALRLLGDHPAGLLPTQLAAELGKSAATARYMVNTLCEAGYTERSHDGRCRLLGAPPWGHWGPRPSRAPAAGPDDQDPEDQDPGEQDPAGLGSAGLGSAGLGSAGLGSTASGPAAPGPAVLAPADRGPADREPAGLGPRDAAPGPLLGEALTDLYRATRQRTYLVRRSGSVVATVCDTRGHQGLARLPGLGAHVPPEHAHALGLTKVLLAASSAYLDAVRSERLTRLTGRTRTCSRALCEELAEVRRRGWAADDGEFAAGFATVAAPIVSPSGTWTVALGLSCSERRFASDRDALADAVLEATGAARRAWARSSVQRPTWERPKARSRR